ncbi:hypothetical protein [Photobacterium kishitanii]|uniref:Uncharacterized protein n=1 Tax=Photobacterium kishitanii TaxID=318456 RepID=A0A2T3KLE4_9GAMM|nr:hypothetical protein [Photobacterium kishitanii]PSV00538.1 hypothetical protein C9J27_05230 [Photobacterium kishitanii]
MIFFSKEVTVDKITEKVMLHKCLPAILSFCTNNSVTIDNGINTTINLAQIALLVRISIYSLDDEMLNATAKLVGLNIFKYSSDSYSIEEVKPVEKLGVIIGEGKMKLDGSLEKVTIIKESDTGYIKRICTSLLGKTVKFIKSPYGKCGIVILNY